MHLSPHPPSTVPQPRPVPLLGNALEMRSGALEAFYRNFLRHGDLFRLRVGARDLLVVSSPELIHTVLIEQGSDFPKADGPLGLLLGEGVVTNTDHVSWLSQRRMMQPMFHKARLNQMAHTMQDATYRMLERWLHLPRQQVVDLEHEMMAVTLDIITGAMFSADVLSQAGTIGPAVNGALGFVQSRIQTPLFLPLEWPLPAHRRFQDQLEVLDTLVYGLIEDRRRASEKPGDLLDMLLEARDADTGEAMSDTQLRDEVLTIFAAGHETTAHTLSFALFALARHPELLHRLRLELDGVLQGRLPGVQDLERLPYLRAVLDETLRLYPAAPIVAPRVALEDGVLGGYAIPAGSWIIPSIYNLHRHPQHWKDPQTFDPERFVGEHARAHRSTFLPFGAGPRKCVGNHLALMEGGLILASVVAHFEVALEPGFALELEQAVTLRSKRGIPVRLSPRAARG